MSARVALVSGASGGLGSAVARRLVADGYDVALTFLDGEEVACAIAAEAVRTGRRALVRRCDLADEQAVTELVGAVVDGLGRIDAVVSMAGPFIPLTWLADIDGPRFRSIMEQDAGGCLSLVHAALPHLREARGCLVAVSTPAVRRHAKRDLLSSAPKAAIEAIVRGVASEEGRNGVRSNAVACGLIQTGLVDKLIENGDFDSTYLRAAERNIPLGRSGAAEDVAEAVAFLVSDTRAGYITGQTLVVDGGFSV